MTLNCSLVSMYKVIQINSNIILMIEKRKRVAVSEINLVIKE